MACSSFHPNRIWNWGHEGIHHRSLPRSKTPAIPVGSILMKPLPGAVDNPHLQTWPVFFVPEPVLSYSDHFFSMFPELTWFIKWVIGPTPVLLSVSSPLILKHILLVVMLNLFPELTDRNAEMEPSLPTSVGPSVEWGLPINDPFLVLSVSQSLSHCLCALLILHCANLKSGFQSCALRNTHVLALLWHWFISAYSQFSCLPLLP